MIFIRLSVNWGVQFHAVGISRQGVRIPSRALLGIPNGTGTLEGSAFSLFG